MRIILSAAVTADGYLDDNTPQRLMISTAADWEAVQQLRASCDAILVGAETLRRDNPALRLRDDTMRRQRMAEGRQADLTKVVLTRSGRLDPAMRFFTDGKAERIVFAPKELPDLQPYTTVISSNGEELTAAYVITELEKRGIGRLLVEGGAGILRMFLREGRADEVRLAVNPQLRLGAGRGGARFRFEAPATASCRRECLDGMEVAHYTLHPDTTSEDLGLLQEAIDESRRCTPCRTSYCVGAVIETCDGQRFRGYTHESSATHHAEQEAIRKAIRREKRRRRFPWKQLVAVAASVVLVFLMGQRAGELHAAHPAPRIHPRGVRPLRTRLFRLLPRRPHLARGRTRCPLLSTNGRAGAYNQCAYMAIKAYLSPKLV